MQQQGLIVDLHTNESAAGTQTIRRDSLQKTIRNSIKLFAELMTKGTEIHPALNAPIEIKNEFPNPTLINSLKEQLKLLQNPNPNQ